MLDNVIQLETIVYIEGLLRKTWHSVEFNMGHPICKLTVISLMEPPSSSVAIERHLSSKKIYCKTILQMRQAA